MRAKQEPAQKAYLLIGIVSLLPFVVVGFLRELDLFEFIELKTLDKRLHLSARRAPQISSQISLITIDAKSEGEEGIGPYPWPPDIYASLLNSLQKVNPTAIGLIAWFNREWEDNPLLPGDKLFVIQPYSVTDSTNRRTLLEVSDWYNLPYSFKHAEAVGFSHFPLSYSDGISRSAQLVVKEHDTNAYRYSLEMLMLCQTYGVSPTAIKLREGFWRGKFLEFDLPSGMPRRIPIDMRGRFFVRFAGNVSAFHPTSFVDALSDSDTAEFRRKFGEKCVLIGITSEGTYRNASTPFGEMSALALRANLLNALLNRAFIWQSSRKGNLFYLACLAICFTVAATLAYRSGHGYRLMLILSGGLMLCHLLFVFGMFVLFDTWIEATGSSLALVLSGVVSSFFLVHLRLRSVLWQLQTTQEGLVKAEKEAVFGVMSARVRHELRNALNLIRAPAEMVRNNFQKQDPLKLRDQPEEIVSEMDTIIGWVTKLNEMIENELSFFQNTHLNLQQQDLQPVLKSALDMMRPLIAENRIQVRLNLPPKIPAVPIDADKMRIVFANLIKNACQAMAPGGELEIAVETPHAASPQASIYVIVKDTGSGITADERARIFEPFYTTKP
ncbi:MAG: CHASE2 domain-containing protein, partial [Candidatus Poribacteria bacterium]|nr:CHASE2 domain-containing protein [Candidatus Poribacteria bacterium]